jgi:hypothetical protein
LIVEARQGSGVAAAESKRPIGENPLGVRQVADYLLDAPLVRSVAVVTPAFGNLTEDLEHVIGLKTANDRKAYSMDHLCMDYEEMRQLDGQGVFESQATAAKEVRDASIFRFITNFVRQKRKAGV